MPSDKIISEVTKLLSESNIDIDVLKLLISEASRGNQYKHVTLSDLELDCNANQQYGRNWSARFRGVEVPEELIKKVGVVDACMSTVYNKVIFPVLEKLTPRPEGLSDDVKWGPCRLKEVPDWQDLLSNGHFVGKQINSSPRTIIIRFVNRRMRNLFLSFQRKFMPKPTVAEIAKGVRYFSVYPDLTTRNHNYLMALKRDIRVKSAWSNDGNLRFTLAKAESDQSDPTTEDIEEERDEIYFVNDIRIPPQECVDKAIEDSVGGNDLIPNRRQTRAVTAGRGGRGLGYSGSASAIGFGGHSQPTGHRGHVDGRGRGGQYGGPGRGGQRQADRSGQPSVGRAEQTLAGGRGAQSHHGGRGALSHHGGRGAQSHHGGRGGQFQAAAGRGKQTPEARVSAPPALGNSPKGEKSKSDPTKLPNDSDLAKSSFTANSFNEQ